MNYHQAQTAVEEETRIDDLGEEEFTFSSGRTDDEIFFAKERFKLHLATPDEGVSLQVLKNYIYKKYGI